MKFCVIFTTTPSLPEAKKLSKTLLQSKLAACINIVNKMESSYWWKGKIETTKESLLMIKSEKKFIKPLVKKIKQIHSYSVPEIIACPIVDGNPDYLNWITKSLRKGVLK